MANTTSGTATFDKNFSIDEIVEEAYERIGQQNVSGYQLKSARRSLNILFQEWANRGLHYWEVANNNITLVADQAVYTMFRSTGDGTSDATAVYGVDDVLEASFRNSNVDTPLTKINRSAYQALSNKTSTGQPTQYFVQRFIDKITITLYLTPGSSEAGNTINYYFVKRIQDVDSTYTDATDVPYRFVPCMVSGLAFYLAQKYAPDRVQAMKLYYEDELGRALAEDGSSSSTIITPKTYYPGA